MTDRNVTVTIGAVLQSNFRTSFREATREVGSLTNAIGALGARRSNTGLNSIRDASQRLGSSLRTLRTEVNATNRSLGILDRGIGRTGSAMGVAVGQARQFTGAIGSSSRAIRSTTSALDGQVTAINASVAASRAAVASINAQIAAQNRLHSAMSRPLPSQAARTAVGGGAGGGGHGGALAGGAMGAAAGHAARHALFGAASGALIGGHAMAKVFENAAEYRHELIMRKQQGWADDEIEQAKREAKRVARETRLFSERENLEVLGDLGFAMGDRHHALDALEAVQKSNARLRQANPNIDANRSAFGAIKALEMMGHAGDKKTIDDWLDKMTSASIASGGKITGTDFQQFAKYAKGAGSFYSQDFLTTIAPSLMQELGASTAGNGLAMARNALVGGRMTRAAANTLNEFGLIDPTKTDADMVSASGGLNRKGSWIGGLSRKPGRYTEVTTGRGAVKDADLLQSDPNAWVQKNLTPIYESVGKDAKKMGAILAQMFSNSSAERVMSIMLLQHDRLEKDRQQTLRARQTSTFEGTKNDPLLAAQRLGKAFTDMTAAIGAPITEPIARGMDAIGDGLYAIADASPETVAGVAKVGAALVGLPALAWASSTAFRALRGSMTGLFSLARSPYFIAFAGAGYLIYKNWDWVKGFAEGALPGIQAGFSRLGAGLDLVVSGGEKLLRTFGLIPAETDAIGSAFGRGTEKGKAFGDFLGIAMPAVAAIWAGRTVLSIVGGMGTITTAAGIMGAALRTSLGQFGALIAAAELAEKYGAGTGGKDKARGWLDYVDPGLGNLLYGRPSLGEPGAPGSPVFGPVAPPAASPLTGPTMPPAGPNAIVVPQSYQPAGSGIAGNIHRTAFGGGNTAQDRASSESRFSEAVRRGVYLGLTDFASGRAAGVGAGSGSDRGGMLQNASFEAGGGFGGIGNGAGSGGGVGGSVGGAGGGLGGGGGPGGGAFSGAGGGAISGAGNGKMPLSSDAGSLTSLIDQEARRAGIDPRIMQGIRAGESGHRSDYDKKDDRIESSWGPFQLNRRRGLGVAFEKETGLDVRDPKTIPAQTRWVAEYIKKHGRAALRNWMGYHGDRDADPRWGNSGYVPGAVAGQAAPSGEGPIAGLGSGGLNGLRVKGSQATAGGSTAMGIADLARAAQADLPGGVKHFGAFNDRYHQGTGSKHALGLAFDTTLNDARQSAAAAEAMRAKMRRAGLSDRDFRVIDEYRNPSARSTGGHIHTQFNNPAAAAQYHAFAEAQARVAKAATAEAAKSKGKVSPGAGGPVTIQAPISIHPHPHQNANDIGKAAADHIHGQTADAGREMRSSTFDWAGA